MSANERDRPIDLDATEFGTRLVSPGGARLLLADCGEDARGPFVWLLPVGEDGYRTGQRRVKLRQADAAAWVVDRQEDEVELSTAGQDPVPGAKSRVIPRPRPDEDEYAVASVVLVPALDEDQPLAARGHGQDDTTHYAHAMTGEGAETPRCGAAGKVALFAYAVTCPRCVAMLVELWRDDTGEATT